jgi:hypothetical protein
MIYSLRINRKETSHRVSNSWKCYSELIILLTRSSVPNKRLTAGYLEKNQVLTRVLECIATYTTLSVIICECIIIMWVWVWECVHMHIHACVRTLTPTHYVWVRECIYMSTCVYVPVLEQPGIIIMHDIVWTVCFIALSFGNGKAIVNQLRKGCCSVHINFQRDNSRTWLYEWLWRMGLLWHLHNIIVLS